MLDASPRARPNPCPPSPAELARLRRQLHSMQPDPDRLPAYAAWLDAELAAQPGRLRAAGLPVECRERPDVAFPIARLERVPLWTGGSQAWAEPICAACNTRFTRRGRGRTGLCPACRPAHKLAGARERYARQVARGARAAQGGAA